MSTPTNTIQNEPDRKQLMRKWLGLGVLALFAAGALLIVPGKIPQSVTLRINLVHMERGPKQAWSWDKARWLKLRIYRDSEQLQETTFMLGPDGKPSVSLPLRLTRGEYRLAIELGFKTPEGQRRDKLERRIRVRKSGTIKLKL